MEKREVLVDVEKLESLLPEKRILDLKDLQQFHRFLDRLWEQARGLPEDFRQKIFSLKEYFYHYLAGSPGPFRPTKTEAIERLNALFPKND